MEIRDLPPPYDAVFFDCDSTLSRIEGIEELGVEHAEEFARLTRLAMDGEVPLERVYGRRLELAAPTAERVADVGRRYVAECLPNARELFAALRRLGKRVAIVSGGVLPAVAVLGEHLGLAREDVHAVDLRFASDGTYAGFDERSPLARAGGKAEVVARLASGGAACLVGDGATDLEAAPACARFVAFGGVVRREPVFAAARATCEEPDLAALLPLLLHADEIDRLRTEPACSGLVAAAARRP